MGQEPDEVAELRRALGERLTAHRKLAGLTQDQQARRLYCDRTTVVRVEAGQRSKDDDFWRRAEEALHAEGALLAAHAELTTAKTAYERRIRDAELEQQRRKIAEWHSGERRLAVNAVAIESETPVPVNAETPLAVSDTVLVRVEVEGRKIVMPVDRRRLLQSGFAAMFGGLASTGQVRSEVAVRPPHLQALKPAQVGELVAHLREQWHLLVKMDNLFGPRYALASVHHYLTIVEDLLPATRDQARREVARLAAQYAESAAWLHEDAGDAGQAQYWTGRALEWAHEADDRVMLAWTLFRRSQQAAAAGDAAQTISLAQAARREEAVLSGPMRAALAQQEAHGYALDGDSHTAHRKLDEALTWAATDTNGDARSGHGSFCTESYLELQRASCWLTLKQPTRAVVLYDRTLPTLPSVYRRDRGVALGRFAAAYAAVNEVEQAATVAREALDIARSAGSARAEREVRAVGRRLKEHRRAEPVAQLLDELALDPVS